MQAPSFIHRVDHVVHLDFSYNNKSELREHYQDVSRRACVCTYQILKELGTKSTEDLLKAYDEALLKRGTTVFSYGKKKTLQRLKRLRLVSPENRLSDMADFCTLS